MSKPGTRTRLRGPAAAAVTVTLLFVVPLHVWAHEPPAGAPHDEGLSADEIAKKLSNPISNIWSLQFQNNMTFLRGNPASSYYGEFTTNFQPVMPLHLNDDWNLILRPVFNFSSKPTIEATGGIGRAVGIGQTSVIALASPARVSKGFLWGAGPTVILPTTTRDELTQGKYAAGPAVVGLHMSAKWVVGIFPQYWWSFAGSGNRSEISQANIQYFVWRSLGGGWQVGMSPNITYDRKADGPNAWAVPVGLGVAKTLRLGKLPIKFQLEGQAYPVHPKDFGPRWNIRFAITPVIPELIKRPLF